MKAYLSGIVLCLLLFGNSFYGIAQETQPTVTPDVHVATKKLDKVNGALQKHIARIKQKLEKKLSKKYPDLQPAQLDSLLQEKVSFLPDSLRPNLSSLCEGCPDLSQLKNQLENDIKLTPPDLDITKELNVSVKELESLQELYQKVQLPDLKNIQDGALGDLKPDVPISEGDLKKLTSSVSDFNSAFEVYKKQFEGWGEKSLAKAFDLEQVKYLQQLRDKQSKMKPIPEGYGQLSEGMQTNDFVKQQLESKAEELKKMGGESLQQKFDKAMVEVNKAKRKYADLKEGLGEAPKRPNPLASEPFHKRLRLGGNLQVNRENPTSVDLAARLGYQLNPKAQIGLETAYRISTGDRFRSFDFDDELFSSRLFFDHFVYKSFFMQAVLEWNRQQVTDQNDVNIGIEWVQSGLIGVGKEFPLGKKLRGAMTISYNVLHDENSPYRRPWVFRFGFRFVK